VQLAKITEILANRLVQQPAAPLPATDIADHPVQVQVGHTLPLFPVRQTIEVFRSPHAPIQMHRMCEAGGAAVFDQAVHLRHAGTGGDQHQRAVR